jgi:hypothetical protein
MTADADVSVYSNATRTSGLGFPPDGDLIAVATRDVALIQMRDGGS